jgi:hypothetical protein
MTTLDAIGEIRASVQEGGWRATGNIFNDADRLEWYRAVESWYYLHRGGAWEPSPRLGFRGHLLPDQWEKTIQDSVAPWQAFTAQEFLKRLDLQGIFFAEAASPANEHQLNVGDTYGDIVEHLLGKSGQFGHWNGVIDIWPEGITRLNIDKANSAAPGAYDLKGGNFWSRLQEIAKIEFYLIWVSKDNIINYQKNGMFQTPLPDVTMDITSAHLMEPLQITPRNTEQVGQVILHGMTPGGEQIKGKYPDDPTAGPPVVEGGFLATSNAQMDTIAERKYKFANRDVTVSAKMPGAMGLLFEVMDRVSITYSSAVDGISWSAKKFWIEDIGVSLDMSSFGGSTSMRLEAENA